MAFQNSPFRTGPNAVLGDALLDAQPDDSYEVDGVDEAASQPSQVSQPMLPAPVTFSPRLVPAPPPQADPLQQLLDEVRGLRADLASRTLTARLTRAWAWLRARWSRLVRH